MQGPGQSLNLRDNGFRVIVGQREGSASWDKAVADGWVPGQTLFGIEEAAERAKIEAEARQEWLTVAPRIEDAALRGRQARSDAEVRITVEQTPIRAKVAELEAMQREKARQEREAEAKRLAQKRIEAEREAVPKDFKLMAQKREMKMGGWGDRGEQWKAAPEGLKKLIDGYNAAPKEMRPAILDRILNDGQRREQVRELLAEQRQQYRANDRGMSR